MPSIIPLNMSWRAGNQTGSITNQYGAQNNELLTKNVNGEFIQSLVSQIDMEIKDICENFIKNENFDKIEEDDLSKLKNSIISKIKSYIEKYKETLSEQPYMLSNIYEKSHMNEMYKVKSLVNITSHSIEISAMFILNMIRFVESKIDIVK